MKHLTSCKTIVAFALICINTMAFSHAEEVSALAKQISSVSPWASFAQNEKYDWANAKEVARLLQKQAPADVRKALDLFMKQPVNKKDQETFEKTSKPLILFRVMFDLPEKAPESEFLPTTKGWVCLPEKAANTVNLAWPIRWNSGKPAFVQQYMGSDGPIYDPVDEYNFLLSHYPFRKL